MSLPPVDRTTPWRPTSADLYPSGASGAVPVRPVNPVTPVESTDGIGRGAATPRAGEVDATSPPRADGVNTDWTERPLQAARKPEAEEKPKEPPLHKQLMELLQSIWRASTQAVDMGDAARQQNAQQRDQQARADQPLTYADPKVKRGSRA